MSWLRSSPRYALACLLLALAACGGQPSPTVAVGVTSTPVSARIARVEAAVAERFAALDVPALSVAIVDDGRVVWAGGRGVADLDTGAEATSTTVYRVGSISKPIAATLVARLAAAGRLDLDGPIGARVEGLPAHIAPLTARQILSHTTGIRHYHYDRGEKENARAFATVDEAIRIYGVLDEPLVFTPGAGYLYSTYAYDLLLALVPAATGHSFAEALRTEVFEPAGMASAAAGGEGIAAVDGARPYRRGPDGGFVPAPPVHLDWKLPGGGVLASVSDLARFVIALDDGRLLSPEDADRLGVYAPVTLPDGASTGYGLGWHVKVDPDGRPWVGHGGGATGGAAYLLRRPQSRFAVAVICNLEIRSAELHGVARAVEAAWTGRPVAPVPAKR